MKVKRFKICKHPETFDDIQKMRQKMQVGEVLVDVRYACLWSKTRDNNICSSFMTRPGCTRVFGTRPDAIEGITSTKIRRAQDIIKSFSTYGIYDQSDLNTANYKMQPYSSIREPEKQDWLALRRLYSGIEVKQKTPKMEFGVELELESEEDIATDAKEELRNKNKDLIYDVGSDGSVFGGTEIRFKHPAMSGWKLDRIARILDDAKALGMKSEYGTAGMHVHISHPKIRTAIENFRNHFVEMQNILYPINCRTPKIGRSNDQTAHYGLGNDMWRDQTSDFGTLEIRAWKATTNPNVFLARLHIARALINYLVSDKEITTEGFFEFLKPKEKEDYKLLLDTENPHKYGLSPKIMKAMM